MCNILISSVFVIHLHKAIVVDVLELHDQGAIAGIVKMAEEETALMRLCSTLKCHLSKTMLQDALTTD
jgi:hypothetical protein